MELTGRARSMQEFSFQVFEAFTAATILYLMLNAVVTIGMRFLERRVRVPGYMTANRAGITTMFAGFDFDVILRSLPYLFLEGMRFTITLTLLATALGIVLGTALAADAPVEHPGPVADRGGLHNFMRSTAAGVVIFWFYFLIPYIGQWITGASRPITVGAFASALITFSLFEAATSQRSCAPASSRSRRGKLVQAMRWYELPAGDAVHRAAAGLPKHAAGAADADHHLVSGHLAGLRAFDHRLPGCGFQDCPRDGRLVEMYLFAAVVYFVISFFLSRLVQRLQARTAIIR